MAQTFLMAGGGTGGHIIPALAVARELRKRGHSVFFVGTERGLEAKLVPAEGFELKKIDVGGLNRVGLAQKISTLMRLPIATLGCVPLVRSSAALAGPWSRSRTLPPRCAASSPTAGPSATA